MKTYKKTDLNFRAYNPEFDFKLAQKSGRMKSWESGNPENSHLFLEFSGIKLHRLG